MGIFSRQLNPSPKLPAVYIVHRSWENLATPCKTYFPPRLGVATTLGCHWLRSLLIRGISWYPKFERDVHSCTKQSGRLKHIPNVTHTQTHTYIHTHRPLTTSSSSQIYLVPLVPFVEVSTSSQLYSIAFLMKTKKRNSSIVKSCWDTYSLETTAQSTAFTGKRPWYIFENSPQKIHETPSISSTDQRCFCTKSMRSGGSPRTNTISWHMNRCHHTFSRQQKLHSPPCDHEVQGNFAAKLIPDIMAT